MTTRGTDGRFSGRVDLFGYIFLYSRSARLIIAVRAKRRVVLSEGEMIGRSKRTRVLPSAL